ncbi:hypothetical protein EDD11_008135, partial [Mortierella claussenii]
KITNTVKEAVGATKEKIGHATHNESMAASGAAENAEAHAQKNANAAHRHAEGVGHNVEGNAQKIAGSATNDHTLKSRGHANDVIGDVQRNV